MADRGSRRARLRGILGIAVHRVAGRLRGSSSRRVFAALLGVAVAVGLMVAVTGVALGLAVPTTVESEGVDYWIVPSDNAASAITVDVGNAQLGAVHRTRARLLTDERIDGVTPVLTRLVTVPRADGNGTEYVLAVGVVPDSETGSIAGVDAGALTPGDPYYANGTYNGSRTGEVVLNGAAATILDATTESDVRLRSRGDEQNFSVVAVAAATDPGTGQLPIAVVHLAELQALTGTDRTDQATQLLVRTNDPGVRARLAGVYPRTTVVAKEGFTSRTPTDELSLAVAAAAFVTALVLGVLFVGTVMGLEVTAEREQLAVFAVVGYSGRSRALLVTSEVLCVALGGGIIGIGLGLGGMVLVDALAAWQFGIDSVTAFHPLLIAYGLGVAVLIGLLAAPYPAWLDRRATAKEVLGR